MIEVRSHVPGEHGNDIPGAVVREITELRKIVEKRQVYFRMGYSGICLRNGLAGSHDDPLLYLVETVGRQTRKWGSAERIGAGQAGGLCHAETLDTVEGPYRRERRVHDGAENIVVGISNICVEVLINAQRTDRPRGVRVHGKGIICA